MCLLSGKGEEVAARRGCGMLAADTARRYLNRRILVRNRAVPHRPGQAVCVSVRRCVRSAYLAHVAAVLSARLPGREWELQ